MLLRNYTLLNTNNQMLIYSENNRFICGSALGYWKIKLSKEGYFYVNNVNVVNYQNSLKLNNENIEFYIDKFIIRYVIRCIYFGNSIRFRIMGRGYKIYSQVNHMLLKLGYSHIINYTLPISYEIHKKDKNNSFYKITGLNRFQLNNILAVIKSFRIPNVYSKKGIFKKDEVVKYKEGKKNFTL
jgi:large subunit ribosomal protein L6